MAKPLLRRSAKLQMSKPEADHLCHVMTHTPLMVRLMVIGLLQLGCSSASQAQQTPSAKTMTTLTSRQELMRLLTQQQQSVLQQRLNCINRATNLAELERCGAGHPAMSHGMSHGTRLGQDGWRCPMW